MFVDVKTIHTFSKFNDINCLKKIMIWVQRILTLYVTVIYGQGLIRLVITQFSEFLACLIFISFFIIKHVASYLLKIKQYKSCLSFPNNGIGRTKRLPILEPVLE